MKEQLLNIELPFQYREGLIEYEEGLDNVPTWIEFSEKGYTKEQFKKMSLLVVIEATKDTLNEAIEYNEITENEIEEARELIQEKINEYNAI